NEFYAMGQLWAFINGNLKVFGITVFKAGLAAALQFQAPNPTWVGGGLELSVYSLNLKLKFNAGNKCRFATDDPADLLGIDVIESLEPFDNAQNISMDQNLIANLALANGDTTKVDFGNGDGLTKVTVEVNLDSTGVYYKGYKLNTQMKIDSNKITLIPENFYPGSDSVTFFVKIDVILPSGAVFASQRKYITYGTEKLKQYIPDNNIEYIYPTRGMVNFYKNEYKKNVGFIKLLRGQGYLFQQDQPVIAKFTDPDGQSFTDELKYFFGSNTIEFALDPNMFENGEYYRMDIVKDNDREVGPESYGKPASGPEND